VHEVDERYTTTAAAEAGARDLDAASAALILDQYLDQYLDHGIDQGLAPSLRETR
jgi:RNase H-fold protein (predicted Holliday junction resolvase)